jgi:hypothetical protein
LRFVIERQRVIEFAARVALVRLAGMGVHV